MTRCVCLKWLKIAWQPRAKPKRPTDLLYTLVPRSVLDVAVRPQIVVVAANLGELGVDLLATGWGWES